MRQRPKSEIACDNCGHLYQKETRLIKLNARRGHKNLCSSACLKEHRTNSQVFVCANPRCNQSFTRCKSAWQRNPAGRVFCSRSCATSDNNKLKSGTSHPNWNGGFATYRKRAIEHHGPQCSICGYNTECCLEVHHIDGNRGNNEIANLLVVCPTHHVEIERGIITV